MGYCLVLLRSGKTAVVPASALRTAGKFQKVKWGNGHLYLARVLAKSNDSVFLQSLSVEENGVIVFGSETSAGAGAIKNPLAALYQTPNEQTSDKTNAVPSDDHEKPCGSRVLSPVTVQSPPREDKANYEVLLEKSTVGSQTDIENVGNCQACSAASKLSTTEQWVQTDSLSTDSKSSQCEIEMFSIGTHTETEDQSTTDHYDSSHESIHDDDLVTDGRSNHGAVRSNDGGIPDDDINDNNHGPTDNFDDNHYNIVDGNINIVKRDTSPWTQSGDGRAELVPGANVFIASDQLFATIADCYRNPREFIRRLIRLLIPRDELLKMTVTGRGWNRRAIPPDVLSAVENCMKKNVEEQLWLPETEFRSVLVKMLDKMHQVSHR